MDYLAKFIRQGIIFCVVSSLILLFASFNVSAEEINWKEVANTITEKQFIDINSIKYNKSGWLSVIVKYTEIDPDDQKIIKTSSYLMAIDCENRLYNKYPVNSELNQVKNWSKPVDNKLIKKTLLI